jgi:hypothetical protein
VAPLLEWLPAAAARGTLARRIVVLESVHFHKQGKLNVLLATVDSLCLGSHSIYMTGYSISRAEAF